MRPCPGQLLGAHAFASGACVDCGEHNPEADVRERDTVAAIVTWLTTKTVAYGDQPKLDDLIDGIERGDWRSNG